MQNFFPSQNMPRTSAWPLDLELPYPNSLDSSDHSGWMREFLHLLHLSMLTPVCAEPSVCLGFPTLACIAVAGRPVLACGAGSDMHARVVAGALARDLQFLAGAHSVGYCGSPGFAEIPVDAVDWSQPLSGVALKSVQPAMRGQWAQGRNGGGLQVVVIGDPWRILATKLCVTTSLARILVPHGPELDDGSRLARLARLELSATPAQRFLAAGKFQL